MSIVRRIILGVVASAALSVGVGGISAPAHADTSWGFIVAPQSVVADTSWGF